MKDNTKKKGRFEIVSKMLMRFVCAKPLLFNLNVNVTTRCNQACPMCNAVLEEQQGDTLTLDKFKELLKAFEGVPIPSVTLSGGEPTLAPEFPKIVEFCAQNFPFGVGMVSNFYMRGEKFKTALDAALKNDIRVACSFDGFGEVAKKQRGVKNSEVSLVENIEWVTNRKKELKSKSKLVINTVVSDQNVQQVHDILNVARKFGWISRLSCANQFFYQGDNPDLPTLSDTQNLADLIKSVLDEQTIEQNRDYLRGIPVFSKRATPKLCPYLRFPFKSAKVFLNPNGDILLCDRTPIGNVAREHFDRIMRSPKYYEHIRRFKECKGCWLPCFVESIIPLSLSGQLKLKRMFRNLIKTQSGNT
ncbi:MAG: radical SAM protein [Pseudomonadota bacterium]